jgi:AcrR family transcriptional regulator
MPATQKVRTAPRKTAVQPRARATVEAILEATARILVREGYEHASTNRIAETAGVSIGSLYQYFPSKEALVAALMERHVKEMSDVLHREAARSLDAPLDRAIEDVVQAMLEAHAVNPKLHKVFVEQVPRIGRLETIKDIEISALKLARAFLEHRKRELRAGLDLELASFIVVATVEALTHAAVLYRPDLLADRRMVNEVRDVVLRYLT